MIQFSWGSPQKWICLTSLAIAGSAFGAEEVQPTAKGIQDNSFLVEEAYNQEPGVVQHILNVRRSINRLSGSEERAWDFVFTQEWPLFRQTHQLSYTVPYSFLSGDGAPSVNGFGDVLLNYRFQAPVAGMAVFTWLALAGMGKLKLQFIEKYECGILGGLLCLLDLLVILLEH